MPFRFYIISLLLLLASVANGQNDSIQKIEEIIELIRAKEYTYAQKQLDRLIYQYPDQPIYKKLNARAVFYRSKGQTGIDLIEKLMVNYPNNADLMIEYGQMLHYNNKDAKADSVYNTTYEYCLTDSQTAYLYDRHSKIKIALVDYDNALKLQMKSLEYAPNSAAYTCNVGYVYLGIKDYEQAIVWFEKANAMEEMWEITNNLALAYSYVGKHDLAIKMYKKILKEEPTDPRALNNMGYAYVEAGKIQTGIDYMLKSLEYWPNNSYAYRNLGLAELKRKNHMNACYYFSKALELGYTRDYGLDVEEFKKANCK